MAINLFDIEKNLSFKTKPVFKYVYVLPNHDIQWVKSVFRKLKIKNDPKFRLLVVGYCYGIIAKKFFPRAIITTIDADPLAILSNAYVVWLKYRFKKVNDISKMLFLDFYRLNRPISVNEFEILLSIKRYQQSINLFKKFIIENFKNKNKIQDGLIKHLFNQIFRINIYNGNRVILKLAPKGFCADILKLRLGKIVPNSVIIDDLARLQIQRNFDAIMSNNSIDFTKNKKYFLKKIKGLIKKNGLIEISSYNAKTIRWLRYVSRNKNVFLGNGIFCETLTDNSMRYVQKPIRMGRITHILKP